MPISLLLFLMTLIFITHPTSIKKVGGYKTGYVVKKVGEIKKEGKIKRYGTYKKAGIPNRIPSLLYNFYSLNNYCFIRI